jgi:hypothetical protein
MHLQNFLQFLKSWRLIKLSLGSIAILLLLFITSCSLPKVSAADRGFLDINLEFLREYQLPKMDFQGTTVGGLSGITYDRTQDVFYAISDDRSNYAPARFYTLKLALEAPEVSLVNDSTNNSINPVAIEKVTFLKENGVTYAPNTIDAEGIALTPAGSVLISSEGTSQAEPSIQEYDLETGNQKQSISIPDRYLPGVSPSRGIQPNLGFESLAIAADGNTQSDPYRIFTATESPLLQDLNSDNPDQLPPLRFLHYLITDTTPPLLISENLYQLDPTPPAAISHGLSEIIALPERGFFLSLEKSYGSKIPAAPPEISAKIYQITTGTATDTSSIPSLRFLSPSFQPIRKKLVLDLTTLGIKLDNLEAMSLGARLADGSQSLILVSDDNFNPEQVTQFLLFKLKIN